MKQNQDWRSFARGLTQLAATEGSSRFLDQAFEFLNTFVTVDSCAVFKVAADKRSGAEHLCTFGNLNPALATLLADDYVENGFKNDPMVRTALLSRKVKVRRLPESHYTPAYRSQYFEKANLVDKVSSIHSSKTVLFLINFYRVQDHGQFTNQDFKDLENIAPIIGRFVLRHSRLTLNKTMVTDDYSRQIKTLLNDNTQIFSNLSEQERNVCFNILLGVREQAIADNLNISKNTVITHRRRAYSKLGLASKTELFQIVLMALT